MIGGLARIAAFAIVGAVVLGAYTVARIWQEGDRDDRRPSDAIVVMGAAQYDGRPSPVFAARLEHAVALYHEGLAPILIVTGGKADGDRTTEAASAREYAIDHGVPERAILIEDRSRNTLESIDGVARIMRANGLRSATFVSDSTHMLRVLRMARDQGIEGYGSPTRTSPIDADPERRLGATARELGALAVYFLTGSAPPEVEPAEADDR